MRCPSELTSQTFALDAHPNHFSGAHSGRIQLRRSLPSPSPEPAQPGNSSSWRLQDENLTHKFIPKLSEVVAVALAGAAACRNSICTQVVAVPVAASVGASATVRSYSYGSCTVSARALEHSQMLESFCSPVAAGPSRFVALQQGLGPCRHRAPAGTFGTTNYDSYLLLRAFHDV